MASDRPPSDLRGEAGRSRWLILFVLFLARTTISFSFQSVATVGPVLVKRMGLGFTELGTLVGLFMLPGVLLALPSGILGQRFGDKRIALCGLALMAAGGFCVASSATYPAALAGRIIAGIGAVPLSILLTKMMADWFVGREIVTAMAFFLSSAPIGSGLALVTLGALAERSSVGTALNAVTAMCALAFLLVAAVYRAPDGMRQAAPSWQVRLSRAEWQLAAVSGMTWSFFNLGFGLLLNFGPSHLVAQGYTVAAAGAMVSLVMWVSVPALPLAGYLAERIGRPDAVMGVCFIALTLAVLAVPAGGAAPLTAFALIGILIAPPPGLILKLPTEVLRPENRAAGMGVYYTCYYAGVALLNPAAGWARDVTGSSAAPIVVAASMFAAALLSLGLFRALQRVAGEARSTA